MVVAPVQVCLVRIRTDPFEGTVNVSRRFVVSNAVIASSDVVAFDTTAAGS
jgi:hypothetical protein